MPTDGDKKFPGHGLASALRGARELAGMSLAELSAASGVGAATLTKLESGISDPRWSTLAKLQDALKMVGIVFEFQAWDIRFVFRWVTDPRPKLRPSVLERLSSDPGGAEPLQETPKTLGAGVTPRGRRKPLLTPFPPYKGS